MKDEIPPEEIPPDLLRKLRMRAYAIYACFPGLDRYGSPDDFFQQVLLRLIKYKKPTETWMDWCSRFCTCQAIDWLRYLDAHKDIPRTGSSFPSDGDDDLAFENMAVDLRADAVHSVVHRKSLAEEVEEFFLGVGTNPTERALAQNLLKHFRGEAHLTLRKLEKTLKVSKSELGRIRKSILAQFCERFGRENESEEISII